MLKANLKQGRHVQMLIGFWKGLRNTVFKKRTTNKQDVEKFMEAKGGIEAVIDELYNLNEERRAFSIMPPLYTKDKKTSLEVDKSTG